MPVVLPLIPFIEGLREAANAVEAQCPNERRNVIFGAHSPLCGEPGKDDVIFNTEFPETFSEQFRARLARSEVWDHSRSNQRGYSARKKVHVPLRWSRVLETIPRLLVRDIDVGFYGSMNQRRESILGPRVERIPFTVGPTRDAWIARCKVIVVPHFYEGNGVEQPRVVHLVANGVCVVAEHAPDEDDTPGPVYETPARLVEKAWELIRSGVWETVGTAGRRSLIDCSK